MNSDVAFVAGGTHPVCQDYGLAGTASVNGTPYPYAVVCDGCSSAPNSDIGARLLAWKAREKIASLAHMSYSDPKVTRYWVEDCAQAALGQAITLGAGRDCLAATLLVAMAVPSLGEVPGVVVIASGDGVIVARERRTGRLWVTRLRYADETPLYPVYLTDVRCLKDYLAAGHGKRDVINSVVEWNCGKAELKANSTRQDANPCPFATCYSSNEFDLVALMSDGAEAVRSDDPDGAIAAVLRELTAFKNTTGEFVKRRVQRAVRDFKAKGWSLGDDLTVAAISL